MRRALGKGLSQLMSEKVVIATPDASTEAPIGSISPNPRQPRSYFDEASLTELADSIRLHGVLQPLVVRPAGEGKFELIAGERRLRASQMAGLTHVPILVRSTDNQTSLELALIENVQREDIGPLEAARAYRLLMDEFDLTQEQVAARVGKSRVVVANTVRLLRLPPRILEALERGQITEAHARPLLALDSSAAQLAMFDRILGEGMTSKDVERSVRPAEKKPKVKRTVVDSTDPNWRALQEKASEVLGAPVALTGSEKGGTVVIRFFSEDDLVRVMDQLGVQL